MTKIYDLHCHSTASDGFLTPTQLIDRAVEKGVTDLALTDHDTVNGLTEAAEAARSTELSFIHGIEISTTWENKCFHIVGLNIDPTNDQLNNGIHDLQQLRLDRAKKIALKLEKRRIPNAYEAVVKAANGGMITRSHFAYFLLDNHYVKTPQEAFDKYLGKGKTAFVSTVWAELHDTVNWINQAGGVAVVAHPLRYKITTSWLKRFLTAFKTSGGSGIEVVTGRSNTEEIRRTMHFAENHQLAASVGSDFHTPENRWVELGRLAALPETAKPVWQLF